MNTNLTHRRNSSETLVQSDVRTLKMRTVISHLKVQCVALAFLSLISACGSGTTNQDEEVVITSNSPVEEPVEQPVEEPTEEPAEMTTLSDGQMVATEALILLGNKIFNDTNLSTPVGQSCASCHSPQAGFVDPNQTNPTSIGADRSSFGTRNAPTASYAAHIPSPQLVMRAPPGGGAPRQVFIGGLFVDGRAESLEEQAKGPFLNPVEMGNADQAEVINKISASAYADDFEQLFGFGIFNDTALAYNYMADAIAAFERTASFSPFTSKFDQRQNGGASFTEAERRGEQLFNGRAQCDRCHTSGQNSVELFTNFEYENIGVPRNPLLPAVMEDPNFVDLGRGSVTNNRNDDGRFRVPTLRNIAMTAPYMHNGVFNTLTEVVEFYNTRDTTFPNPPEVRANLNQAGEIGELGLSRRDVDDLVAFLQTLTDQ